MHQQFCSFLCNSSKYFQAAFDTEFCYFLSVEWGTQATLFTRLQQDIFF